MILKYFISAVGEFQNGDFDFHTFGTFVNITRHCADAPGAKVFVCITYRPFFYMCYSFHSFGKFRMLTQNRSAAPECSWRQRATAPRLDAFFVNAPSLINLWRRPQKFLTRKNSCRWKNILAKRIRGKKPRGKKFPLVNAPPPRKRYHPA